MDIQNMHARGIEPREKDWKSFMLPLHHACPSLQTDNLTIKQPYTLA